MEDRLILPRNELSLRRNKKASNNDAVCQSRPTAWIVAVRCDIVTFRFFSGVPGGFEVRQTVKFSMHYRDADNNRRVPVQLAHSQVRIQAIAVGPRGRRYDLHACILFRDSVSVVQPEQQMPDW